MFGLFTENSTLLLTAQDKNLGLLNIRTGKYEILVAISGSPGAVTYDLSRNAFYWVDDQEIINVYVRGYNASKLYPGKCANSITLYTKGRFFFTQNIGSQMKDQGPLVEAANHTGIFS